MEADNFEDDERCDRTTIIKKITVKLCDNRWLMPSASQERSYKEALCHVARVCSNNTDNLPPGAVLSRRLKGCSRDKSRKHCLKDVLALLQSMERKRLYDPPGDDEIQSYMLLQRSTRSLITFCHAHKYLMPDYFDCANLGWFTTFPELAQMQGLVELHWHFADLSAFVSEMDIRNGSSIKPWMSVKDSDEMKTVICGSKEKSNMFYNHKFSRALLDLRSTEFLFCPPSTEEMRCYVQVTSSLAENHGQPSINKEKRNIYSSQLDYHFRERIHREASDIMRHFREIAMAMFEKLSISEHSESFGKKLVYDMFSQGSCSLFESFADFGKEMAEKYKGSDQDLPSYITHVDQCRFVASYMSWLFSSCKPIAFKDLAEVQHNPLLREHLGWISLHAVTLLKRGSVVNRSLFQSHPRLQKVNIEGMQALNFAVPREVLHESKRKCKCSSPNEGKSDNVKTLDDILEIFRVIGDADMKLLDEEEKQIMIKIWQNVASSVHFFFLAMAYEHRRFLMEHDVSPSG